MRCLVAYDFEVSNHPFTLALRRTTAWDVEERGTHYIAGHAGFGKLKRKAALIPLALHILRHNQRYDLIVCWQQDLGLVISFIARLLRLQWKTNLAILTFIAPRGRRQSWIRRCINYALGCDALKFVSCHTRAEIPLYRNHFPNAKEKLVYSLWGEEYPNIQRFAIADGGYIVAAGRSNRDNQFLIDAVSGQSALSLMIVDDSFIPPKNVDNVRVVRAYRDEYMAILASARAVALAFDDPLLSAGQMVFLNALQLGKPILITAGRNLEGYAVEGVNCLICPKEISAFREALSAVSDPTIASRMAVAQKEDFKARFSYEALARQVYQWTAGGAIQ